MDRLCLPDGKGSGKASGFVIYSIESYFYLHIAIHDTNDEGLILFAFITGNSSLEPLLESLLSQIHMDLPVSSRVFARIEPGTCG